MAAEKRASGAKRAEARSGDLLSVREALEAPALAGARVLAGQAGLKRVVTSVTVGEVPDIADWLTGGELVLSTLYAVAGDTAAQLAFVEQLISHRAAGLITKPGRFVEQVDPAVLKIAQKRGFPIVAVDEAIRWTEVVREVYEIALGKTVSELRRSEAIHRDLVRVAAEGEDFAALAGAASKLIGRPVAISDEQGRELAIAPARETLRLAGPRALSEALSGGGSTVKTPASPGSGHPAVLTIPVLVGGTVLGAVGTSESTPLAPLDLVALEHTATVAAILIGREQIRLQTELRMRGDLLAEIVSSRPSDTESLVSRAALLGCDISAGVLVIGMRLVARDGGAGTLDSERERALAGMVETEHPNALVARRGPDLFALLGAQGAAPTERLADRGGRVAERVRSFAAREWPESAAIFAVGRAHPPTELRDALREAEVSLEVAAGLGDSSTVTAYDDVGTFKLLLALAGSDPAELRRFVAETVDPLREHDPDLVQTLEAYLDLDANIGEVASKLFLHRHTVRYRLDRIATLTGLDVRTSEGRERLSLGLKAARLLATIERPE